MLLPWLFTDIAKIVIVGLQKLPNNRNSKNNYEANGGKNGNCVISQKFNLPELRAYRFLAVITTRCSACQTFSTNPNHQIGIKVAQTVTEAEALGDCEDLGHSSME